MSEERLLTIEEVSKILRLDASSVRRLCREGKLPALRVGRGWRFRQGRLWEWLDAREIHPPGPAGPGEKEEK